MPFTLTVVTTAPRNWELQPILMPHPVAVLILEGLPPAADIRC